MYRFKWPVKFSLLKSAGKFLRPSGRISLPGHFKKMSKTGAAVALITAVLIFANGAFWLFRAYHGGLPGGGAKSREPREWEINMNEKHLDEEEVRKQYGVKETGDKTGSVNENTTEKAGNESGRDSMINQALKAGKEEEKPGEKSAASSGGALSVGADEVATGGEKNRAEENSVLPAGAEPALAAMAMPVMGKVITDYAVDRLVYSKTLEQWNAHHGIDIAAQQGSPVKAVMDGTVVEIRKDDPRLGVVVVIDHGGGIKTVYGNLASDKLVQKGQGVKKGQVIGAVGKTAPYEIEDPPHLHFEVLKGGSSIDPQRFLPEID
ncbi:peptidoglycan DD-metalloendopeptidase family protein [Thermoanaerobacterium sp. DL9XJH110]|uniref:peptidoglycan DD-metalloendopeptidase family protein n=1 Tax=Thermoanaerobacterium sp. DL9XJH110 TaxID=3386643 RepID=UPI003BB56662